MSIIAREKKRQKLVATFSLYRSSLKKKMKVDLKLYLDTVIITGVNFHFSL